jgi:galactokinase
MLSFAASDLANLTPTGGWTDYPVGVARELIRAGYPVAPANLLIRSTVPAGAGLSSSAALEVSTALALLAGREIEPLELALLCQRAEREFVGVPCGIMDQFISVHGRRGAAVEIDCRSLDYRTVELPTDAAFFAVNTMVKHALAGSAYRDRVRECAEAAAALGVASLRDATIDQLKDAKAGMSDVAMRRARHVITENQRVREFAKASTEQRGQLMYASHRSLRDDYEVSCLELDFLVEAASQISGVYGARMTGGGFGGCIVAMVHTDAAVKFEATIAEAYRQRFAVAPRLYLCSPADGAMQVNNFEIIPPAGELDYKST